MHLALLRPISKLAPDNFERAGTTANVEGDNFVRLLTAVKTFPYPPEIFRGKKIGHLNENPPSVSNSLLLDGRHKFLSRVAHWWRLLMGGIWENSRHSLVWIEEVSVEVKRQPHSM